MKLIISLAALLCVVVAKPSDDYIMSSTSSNLVHSVAERDAACPDNQGSSDMSTSEKTDYLNQHNTLRSKEGVPALVWDDSLAAQAQKLIDERTSCEIDRTFFAPKCGGTALGQNLEYESSESKLTGNIAASKTLQKWYAEKKSYNYDSNLCDSGKICSNYIQVVWKDTKKMGCAGRNCGNDRLVVCNYFPLANSDDGRPY